jgi:hypothetical protein
MPNDVSIFNNNDLVIPSYLDDFLADEDNIKPRAGVPTLSYRGRKWSTIINGEKTTFVRRNAEGDEEPVGVLRVIVLDFAQKRGRTFYEGKFDPEVATRPDCWSADGEIPDSSVEAPQCASCSSCPMSVKGSKINELGKETTACSMHRLVAVVPAGNLEHAPMRLKLSITSDFDSQSPDLEKAGWYAFRNYTDYLRTRQIKHTSAVITKIKFDPNKDFPKVIFSPEGFINAAQAARIAELVRAPEVKALITETWTPNGEDGTRKSQEPAPAQKNAQTERPKVIEGTVTEPFITDEMKETDAKAAAAAKAKKAAETRAANAAAKKAEEAKAAAPAEEEVDAFAPANDTPKPAAAPTSGEVPADVADLLSAWGG